MEGPGNGRRCHCPGRTGKQLIGSTQLGLGASVAVDQGSGHGCSLNVDEGKRATEWDFCTLSSQRRDPERQCVRSVWLGSPYLFWVFLWGFRLE